MIVAISFEKIYNKLCAPYYKKFSFSSFSSLKLHAVSKIYLIIAIISVAMSSIIYYGVNYPSTTCATTEFCNKLTSTYIGYEITRLGLSINN